MRAEAEDGEPIFVLQNYAGHTLESLTFPFDADCVTCAAEKHAEELAKR